MFHFVLFCLSTATTSYLNSKSNKISRDGILSDSSTTKLTHGTSLSSIETSPLNNRNIEIGFGRNYDLEHSTSNTNVRYIHSNCVIVEFISLIYHTYHIQ